MSPRRQRVAEQWDEFARAVLPPGVPEIQRREMRRAFYAGAEALLFRVIQDFAPEGEPTDADVAVMEEVHQEIRDYARLVKEGRA